MFIFLGALPSIRTCEGGRGGGGGGHAGDGGGHVVPGELGLPVGLGGSINSGLNVVQQMVVQRPEYN